MLACSPFDAEAKTASTIYTPAMTANARANIVNYSWAQSYRDGVLNYANNWLNMSDEQIWAMPVEQTVPRSIYVHPTLGCPIHGNGVGMYGWKVDPKNKPWKVQCPIGGETWPTNDFGKYYNSGKDSHHVFQSSLANRGELYSTDSSRSYGVDDGTGYVSGNGTHYNFIAYYAHWGVWQNVGRSWSQALVNLGEAYVLTGNAAYAHKAAILLSRIADLLPAMDTNYWSSRGYPQGDGTSGRGLILGQIWDAALASAIARSYDAIFPALNNDTALYTFLRNKSSQYGLTMVDTPFNFQQHIENHALVPILNATQARRIRANEGIHQRAYAEAAIALDSPAATPQWLSWIFQPGTVYDGGGHLPAILMDWIDRDGASNEASPGYNAIWLEAIVPLADLLHDSPYASVSLSNYPNFRNFLSFPYWLQLLPNYYPHIGDDGSTGNPGIAPGTEASRYAAAFNRYGYPELAQMAYDLNGGSSAGLHGSIYDPGAAQTAAAIDQVITEKGALSRAPIMMTGYGLATLTATAGGKEAAIWLYSGRQNKHGHWDRLNLGLFAYGLDLMPDDGYPDFPTTDSWNYWGWQNNTVAHNTVVVNARRQDTTPAGVTMAHMAEMPIQYVEADGNGVYGSQGAGTYHRSVFRVPTPGGFYMLDLFRVQGGGDHLYSLHSGPGAVSTSGLNLTAQSGGTYAGANVGFASQSYDGGCCTAYMGSGFQFLDGVAKDSAPGGDYQAEWSVADNWNVLSAAQDTRVRLWSAGDKPSSVALANGHPPSNKAGNPASLRYLLERRVGAAPLTSTFVHVIEPYVGAKQVVNVQRFTPSPSADANGFTRVGVRVTLADGRVDTIIHGFTPASVSDNDVAFTGRGAVLSRKSGALESAYLISGTSVKAGTQAVVTAQGLWQGSVVSVDESNENDRKLFVTPAAPVGRWSGRYVRVAHAGGHDPFYKIERVETSGTSSILHLGRTNFVRGHVSLTDYNAGVLYDVAAGDAFEVQSDSYGTPANPAVIPPSDSTDAQSDIVNVALGRVATASSSESAELAPAKAIDGNMMTRWGSNFTDKQWIRIDLGQTHAISRIVLHWEEAFGKDYVLQTSLNGKKWTTIKSVTGNTSTGSKDYTDLTAKGRYVRMLGIARGTPYGYSLREFEIYGSTDLTRFSKASQKDSGLSGENGGGGCQTSNGNGFLNWLPLIIVLLIIRRRMPSR